MAAAPLLNPEWLDDSKRFAFPDWSRIRPWLDANVPPEEQVAAYDQLVRDWLGRLAAAFPGEMELSESENFVLIVPKVRGRTRATLAQLEDYLAQILRALAGLELPEASGRIPVIVTPDQDTFVNYLADYYGDGEHMMPGGVCLRQGYVHFVLPEGDLNQCTPVLAHELAHVCVTGIPWPLWVEEAVVQAIEHKLSQRRPYILDRETVGRHRGYWSRDRIRDFWTGASFNYPDEGSELSYHLCRFLLEAVAQHGRGEMLEFLNRADFGDAGFAAFADIMGCSPAELLADLLGSGDWGRG